MELQHSNLPKSYSQTQSFVTQDGHSATWIQKANQLDSQVNKFLMNDRLIDCEKTETVILPDENMMRVITYVIAHIDDKSKKGEMESVGMMEKEVSIDSSHH